MNQNNQISGYDYERDAATDPPLSTEQITNWRRVIPELRNATDLEIQIYRDRLQQHVNNGEQTK